METSRIDNVDDNKLSDSDECEPFVELKAKAARRNFQSTWLEKFKWLRYNNTKGMLCSICIDWLDSFFYFSQEKNIVSPKKLECPLEYPP